MSFCSIQKPKFHSAHRQSYQECPNQRGRVFDPANQIDGEVRDPYIDDEGKFVNAFEVVERSMLHDCVSGWSGPVHACGGGAINSPRVTPEDHRWAHPSFVLNPEDPDWVVRLNHVKPLVICMLEWADDSEWLPCQ